MCPLRGPMSRVVPGKVRARCTSKPYALAALSRHRTARIPLGCGLGDVSTNATPSIPVAPEFSVGGSTTGWAELLDR